MRVCCCRCYVFFEYFSGIPNCELVILALRLPSGNVCVLVSVCVVCLCEFVYVWNLPSKVLKAHHHLSQWPNFLRWCAVWLCVLLLCICVLGFCSKYWSSLRASNVFLVLLLACCLRLGYISTSQAPRTETMVDSLPCHQRLDVAIDQDREHATYSGRQKIVWTSVHDKSDFRKVHEKM